MIQLGIKNYELEITNFIRVLFVFLCIFVLTLMNSCRKEQEIHEPETEQIDEPKDLAIRGFYLLNEGNMGSNKSTLDYFCYDSGVYHRNIFASVNPTVPKELGDVGNDIAIYGNRLYAVINSSHKIEVMDAQTAKRIGQINIPNCRYIKFYGGYAYVTSYAGPVQINPNYEQRGYVAKVDTATLQVVATCLVGFQPDQLEIVNGKIYVANSGGYMAPNYESTVSVICIEKFEEIKRIEVAINLHRLRADRHGNLWVSSRGDHRNVPSKLFWIDLHTDELGGSLDIGVSNFWLDGDSLYIFSVERNDITNSETITYGIVDVAKKKIVSRNFITDGTERNIERPYGIMVNPITKDIYLTDAGNYVLPGMLYRFDRNGVLQRTVRTGDIPAHFALLWK